MYLWLVVALNPQRPACFCLPSPRVKVAATVLGLNVVDFAGKLLTQFLLGLLTSSLTCMHSSSLEFFLKVSPVNISPALCPQALYPITIRLN